MKNIFDIRIKRPNTNVSRVRIEFQPGARVGRFLKLIQAHRLVSGGLALLTLASLIIPVAEQTFSSSRYKLSSASSSLLGSSSQVMAAKLTRDETSKKLVFNSDGLKKSPAGDPAESVGSSDSSKLYSAEFFDDVSKGVTITDNVNQLTINSTPLFKPITPKAQANHVVYPAEGAQLVYTLKANGAKEDIILDRAPGDIASFQYKLNLPGELLEARLTDDGGVGVYSADPTLFGNISFGSDQDRAKVEAARKNGQKTNLVFSIPAPIIKQSNNAQCSSSNAQCPKARFELRENILTVKANNLKKASYPLSIDPTFIVTSSSDFRNGNNEGGIDFDDTNNQIKRGGLTGGTIGSWSSASLPARLGGHASVVANGKLYIIGGRSLDAGTQLNTVYYATLNSSTGAVGSFTATSSFTNARYYHTAATSNGYVYIMGGYDNSGTVIADTQYAKFNSDGTLSGWTATSALTSVRFGHSAATNNGYVYVLGGCGGIVPITGQCSGTFNDTLYAKVKGDGTLSAWTATTAFTTGRGNHGSVAYNGYLYIHAGCNTGTVLLGGCNTILGDTQYAKINSDGTVGSWTTTGSTYAGWTGSLFVYNGYLYMTANQTTIMQYAIINANGSVGSWVATTSLTTDRYSSYAVAYNGYLYVPGGFFSGAADARSDVLYAKIDPAGAVTSFADSGNNFTTARWGNGAAVYNGYVYVVGGCSVASCHSSAGSNAGFLATVYSAPINSTGTLGNWTAQTSIPAGGTATAGRLGATVVAHNHWLYVIGGVSYVALTDTRTYNNNVLRANLATTGSLANSGTCTPWCTSSNTFTTGRYFHTSAVYNNELYIIDGSAIDTFNSVIDSVQHATFNVNGDVGTFSSTNSPVTQRATHATVIANGFIYVIGGNGGSGPGVLSSIERAQINSDGTLGTWTSTGNTALTTATRYLTAYSHKGKLYVVGGLGGTTIRGDIQSADIASDGTIGGWTTSSVSLGTTRFGHGGVMSGDFIYAIGGCSAGTASQSNGCTTFQNTSEYGTVNNGGPGTVGSWTTSGNTFTTARTNPTSIVVGGKLWIMGGQTATDYLADTQYATLSSDGSMSAWAAGPSFNTARSNHSSVVLNNFVYLIGGSYSPGALGSIEYAKIMSDGSLSTNSCGTSVTWCITSAAMPTACYYHGSTTYNGFIYIVGGFCDTSQKVRYAQPSASGDITSWQTTTDTPDVRKWVGRTVVAVRGYLYVVGGCNASSCTADDSYLSSVIKGQINSDGTIASWQYTSGLTQGGRRMHGVIAVNGFIYSFGGDGGTGYTGKAVEVAAILANGQLGPWQTTTDIQFAASMGIAASNGFVYILAHQTPSNATRYAPLQSIPRKGTYSRLLDCEADCTPTKLLTRGSLGANDSTVTNSYACSTNASPTLGSTTSSTLTLGNMLTIPYQIKRYCWLSYTLDDSLSAVFPDSSSDQTSLSDFNLYYHAASTRRLKLGKTFTGGSQQSLDAQP